MSSTTSPKDSTPATAPRRPRRFTLKLAELANGRWMSMQSDSMGGWASTEAKGNGLYGPGLLDQHFGTTVNYGALFTYLFRRFGFPNRGSDDYKEIACYALTTPLPDMVMMVSPSVGEWPRLSIKFVVTLEAWDAMERAPRRKWAQDLAAWVEAQGPLPNWMDEWLDIWRTKPGIAEFATGDRSDWVESITDMHFVGIEVKDRPAHWSDELYGLFCSVAEFVDRTHREFEAIEPHPAHIERTADWRTWPDSDPLKHYHAAAAAALEDLSRPVRIRDAQINAHGLVPDSDPLARRTLREPSVAGYPSGSLANEAPAAVAALHGHVLTLGKGNVRRGVDKLLAKAGLSAQVE
ncbi:MULTISPECIES: hypothetical protein [unclassified Rhodanobacter]|uniref:hypothetical protein n=1 Tax=unclassified Rhodanobacter TaxID=2621553 RepID=UPI0012905BFE|nr:hypothetical protein [Rhodanobacter sp. FW510-R10]